MAVNFIGVCMNGGCALHGEQVVVPPGKFQDCEGCREALAPAGSRRPGPLVAVTDFEGNHLLQLTYEGRPAWLARDIGRLLGYGEDGKNLLMQITRDWCEELMQGVDFFTVTGEALAHLKSLVENYSTSGLPSAVYDSLSSRAPSAMILFESGLNLVCLLSKKPVGVRLRRWLADSVLPRLARGEGVDPTTLSPQELRRHPHYGLRLPPGLEEVQHLLDLYERARSLGMPEEALGALSSRLTAALNPRPHTRRSSSSHARAPGAWWMLLPGEAVWLSVSEVADRFGISKRCAQLGALRAAAGLEWRGMSARAVRALECPTDHAIG